MNRTYKKISLANEGKTRVIIIYQQQTKVINAEKRSYEDFKDEVLNGGNECARIDSYCECNGKKYVHWYDAETLEEFLSEIN